MKKVLSLVLAAMMVMAMGVTAFAADDYASDPLYAAFYDKDSTETSKWTRPTDDSLTIKTNDAASKAFVWLVTSETGEPSASYALESDVDDVKLTAKVTEGKEYVSSVELATEDDYNDGSDDHYGILIKFKDYFDIDKETIKIDLTIKSKRGSTLMDTVTVTVRLDNKTPVLEIDDNSLDMAVSNGDGKTLTDIDSYKFSNDGADFTIKDLVDFQDQIEAVNNKNTIAGVDFKAGIEYLELNADLFSFSVKMSEQGKMALDFDQKAIKEVAREIDPDVELTFFNFNARPDFDFTGTAEIYLPDEDVEYYLYEVDEDGVVKEVRGASLNDDGDAIEFKTRTLGSYILADAELDLDYLNQEPADEETTEPEAPVDTDKENPGTGAAVVAIAAAL